MRHSEDNLQINMVRWFRLQYPELILHHSPNGGKRTQFEAMQFKRMGTIAGFADLFLLKANKDYYGLFIEVKASNNNKQTEAQKRFEANVTKNGYKYVVCRSLDEFILEINEYLNLELWKNS